MIRLRNGSNLFPLYTTGGLISSLVNFLAPPGCCLCRESLSVDLSASSPLAKSIWKPSLCADCQALLPRKCDNLCQVCGAPLGPHIQSSQGCVHCRGSRFAFSGVVTLGTYEGELKRMCQLGKSAASQPLVNFLTERLCEQHEQLLKEWNCTAIVNVPMHWRKRISRSCHPNEQMAACLADKLDYPYQNNWLRQSIMTASQSSLSPHLRRKNVAGVYAAKKNSQIQGSRILLVDDILTTGATAHHCSKALLERGAEVVFVVVLARGLGR